RFAEARAPHPDAAINTSETTRARPWDAGLESHGVDERTEGGWMGLLLGETLVGLALVGLVGFVSWRRRILAGVLCGGEMARTARGSVEFATAGTGPVILQLHGGASGYDQPLVLSWDLHEAGFTVLTPSRPGYLRTPLTTGA